MASSLTTVESTAQRLRDGLGALVTLVSGGLLIANPDRTQLDDTWRITATVLLVLGLAAAGIGFVIALRITARVPAKVSLPDIQAKFGSLQAWQVSTANSHLHWLKSVEWAVVVTLLFLIAGIAAWTLAPEDEPSPVVVVSVQNEGDVCGDLQSADGGVVRLEVEGQHATTSVPFDEITNIDVVETCP